MSSGNALDVYVDTSFLVAVLSKHDLHHTSATTWLSRHSGLLVTSVLAEIELARAMQRNAVSNEIQITISNLLGTCELVELTSEIREIAAKLRPFATRSLDAIHVATAVVAGLESFASYDARQIVAAEEAGLTTVWK